MVIYGDLSNFLILVVIYGDLSKMSKWAKKQTNAIIAVA